MKFRGTKLTVAQKKKILKYGKAIGINEKNIGDYLYKSLEYVPVNGESLGRFNEKREKYVLVNLKENSLVEVMCDTF